MKRKALLIGNTHGLPGVKIDLKKFKNYLASEIGGAWLASEIETIQNPSKSSLLNKIEITKLQQCDYVVVLFSGHGGHARHTILEINQAGETIEDSQLHGISPRQLTIHDCCRSILEPITESAALDSVEFAARNQYSNVRQRYNSRIMQAIPQQAKLYSCSIGQVANETNDGGIYTSNLLASARKIPWGQTDKTIGVAHQEAIEPTQRQSKAISGKVQMPDSVLPRCLTQQQLIISIRP